MKILICIKPVINSSSGKVSTLSDPTLKSVCRINHYDEYSIEEAVRIKEKHNNCTVDTVSIGPDFTDDALRRSLAKGADNSFHITTDIPLSDSRDISGILAAFIRKNEYDIIMTGITSELNGPGITGPLTAGLLKINLAPSVVSIETEEKYSSLKIRSELEGGIHQVMTIKTPCLLTIQSGINIPRYPVLSDLLRSKKQIIEKISLQPDRSIPISTTIKITENKKTEKGIRLPGTPEEKADQLLEHLHRRSLL